MPWQSERDADVVIVGGGHNGLVCAALLAAAGRSVIVLEAREVVGGAAVTEEFHPGFRNSSASYTVSLLDPKVIAELDLHENGLRIVHREIANFWPLSNRPGDYLKLTFDADRNREEFARISPEDAAALPRYGADIEAAAYVLRDLVHETPPNLGGGVADLWRALKTGNRLRRLPAATQALVFDLFTVSAEEFLRRYFRHDAIVGAFAFDGVVGSFAAPSTPGTAYVLLHHAFGEVNGRRGQWGHAIGGMGAITGAMRKAAEIRGVKVLTEAAVAEVSIEDGAAVGVRTVDGRKFRARAVAANVNPKRLIRDLVPDGAVLGDKARAFRERMAHYQCGSGSFRMNLALCDLPQFACLSADGPAEHHRSGIVVGPSVGYLERAYLDAKRSGWSREPVVEMLIPSTLDDSLAPAGAHVASLFCQQFAPTLADGRSWDDARAEAAETIVATLEHYAPGVRDLIVGMQIHSPLDLERKFGLVGGDIFHGRLSLDQMFAARPALGAADYRMPIKGLYLCGSGAHPGGGVTGVPGRNCAREMLKDL